MRSPIGCVFALDGRFILQVGTTSIKLFILRSMKMFEMYNNSSIYYFMLRVKRSRPFVNSCFRFITYQKKTPAEHVLLRPGMYVGQVEPMSVGTWIYDSNVQRMVKKTISYSPALIKIFDEIIVNAADNRHRDKKMKHIDVSVACDELGKLVIAVKNDGKGIPVEIHPTENIYIPELIFGHLMTGSNFDDSQRSITGGRHGYGAKLTNLFSNRFALEVFDSRRKLHYCQTWEGNMSKCASPCIKQFTGARGDYTKVEFEPDLKRFHTTSVGKSSDAVGDNGASLADVSDAIAVIHRRVLDISACLPSHISMSFNGVSLARNSFLNYVKLFKGRACEETPTISNELNVENIPPASKLAESDDDGIFYTKINDRWEIAVMKSPSGSFEQMSFVNSVCTNRGGSHVSLVLSQLVDEISAAVTKQCKSTPSPGLIRNNLMLFVNCDIENPSFDSQSKDTLTSAPATFGSECVIPKKFLKSFISNSNVVQEIVEDIKMRQIALLSKSASRKKMKGKKLVIAKLEDAHLAGTDRSLDCSLIVTEGDSAKALAVAGLEVVGRSTFGVLPVRGKILNVRGVSLKKLSQNTEIMSLCKAMGLSFDKTYENGLEGEKLRYGSIILMTDQDNDGSHIKGLMINFFHYFWPNLLKVDGFLQQFITPLVKVKVSAQRGQGKSNPKTCISFYSLSEYHMWLRKLTAMSDGKAIQSVKFYKGLGTSTSQEGKEYFQDLDKHKKPFYYETSAEENDDIDMAFNFKRAEDRRNWLSSFDPNMFIDPIEPKISYEDFVNKELIHFSSADNIRSLPSVIDGLKPSQRKVLHSCFKRKLTTELKVVQLAGYVAEHTSYHHGEASLHSTIVHMAQNFVGANNLPLLVPAGQFGTRNEGGADFASPRYIFTHLSSYTRYLFPALDDSQLEFLREDDCKVEPKYFIPIIPTLLVNGSVGIGTGWSTSIPQHSPDDIIRYIVHILENGNGSYVERSDRLELIPWCRNFKGEMIPINDTSMLSRGCVERKGNSLTITELPQGVWTSTYKTYLTSLLACGEISNFVENHSSTSVHFTVTASKDTLDKWEETGLYSKLKLESHISLRNMHAFDSNGTIKHFESAHDIVDDFLPVRLNAYERRKEMLIKSFTYDRMFGDNKARFIQDIIGGKLSLFNSKNTAISEDCISAQLQQLGFASDDDLENVRSDAGSKNPKKESKQTFKYLLEMPIQSITEDKYHKLLASQVNHQKQLNEVMELTPIDMWLLDLNLLKEALQKHEDAS